MPQFKIWPKKKTIRNVSPIQHDKTERKEGKERDKRQVKLTRQLGDAGKHASYEALVVLAAAGNNSGLLLLVCRHIGESHTKKRRCFSDSLP